jgi:hypothetical protein
MTAHYACIALAAAGAFGLTACESDNVSPASSGTAAAGAPTTAPQGSNSSGQPFRRRPLPPETPRLPPGSP